MRSHFQVPLLIILGALVLVGCSAAGNKVTKIQQAGSSNSNGSGEATYADGARRVTTVELHELIKKNEAFVVDVRNDASFKAGHIPGAKLIPATEILNHIDELPKNKLIVTYCS
jgi:3-mercaptopyruvate sulfurtransferase SseA